MYFWNVEKLKETIRNGKLTEKSRFIYLLIYVVLSGIGVEVVTYFTVETPNLWDMIDSALYILIPLVGTYFAYKSNDAGNGSDFLGKYFSLGFVVSVRFIVYLMPLLVLYFLYYLFAHGEQEVTSTTWFDVMLFQTWFALLYWRLCVHIKEANS